MEYARFRGGLGPTGSLRDPLAWLKRKRLLSGQQHELANSWREVDSGEDPGELNLLCHIV